ncbi:hypothetical protein [Amycolatopsis benzoatilytica]|uniref:hypothetical protein n=1 Tax=Amycolatopsis benzoatilytica TaxID=346045 RepID=UPI0012B6A048|nr:hypothetical protein [Amycolatopsis benzoatilytica]
MTVTFHEPDTPALRRTARPAALPSRPMSGSTQTWQVIVVLLALTAGAAAIVFAAAGAIAGTGAAGGLALGLTGAVIRKRRKPTRSF